MSTLRLPHSEESGNRVGEEGNDEAVHSLGLIGCREHSDQPLNYVMQYEIGLLSLGCFVCVTSSASGDRQADTDSSPCFFFNIKHFLSQVGQLLPTVSQPAATDLPVLLQRALTYQSGSVEQLTSTQALLQHFEIDENTYAVRLLQPHLFDKPSYHHSSDDGDLNSFNQSTSEDESLIMQTIPCVYDFFTTQYIFATVREMKSEGMKRAILACKDKNTQRAAASSNKFCWKQFGAFQKRSQRYYNSLADSFYHVYDAERKRRRRRYDEDDDGESFECASSPFLPVFLTQFHKVNLPNTNIPILRSIKQTSRRSNKKYNRSSRKPDNQLNKCTDCARIVAEVIEQIEGLDILAQYLYAIIAFQRNFSDILIFSPKQVFWDLRIENLLSS